MNEKSTPPWYRQFWPWFLIGILSSAIVATIGLMVVAVSHPDTLVISESEYQELNRDFRPDPATEPMENDGDQDD